MLNTKTELHKRKPIRLNNYDYSKIGSYFITICTKNRKNLFWSNVGATIGRPKNNILNKYGLIAKDAIHNIPKHYPCVSVDKYVIMPNHIDYL